MSWSGGEVVLGAVTVRPLVGTSATATDLLCGPGEAVAGMGCRAGWVVDAVGMTCVVLDEGAAVCGDGAVDTGESCDDANAVDTDGCSGCAVDAGWTCVGDPSVCTQGDTGPIDDTGPVTDTGPIDDTGLTLPSTTDTALPEATEATETVTTDSTTGSPPGAPLNGEAVDGCACGSSPPGRSCLWAWPIARWRGW